MFCPHCSTQNPIESNFCRVCGASIKHLHPAVITDLSGNQIQNLEPQYPHGLKLKGTFSLSLGVGLFLLLALWAVFERSIGLAEILIVLPICSGLVAYGLKNVLRARDEQKRLMSPETNADQSIRVAGEVPNRAKVMPAPSVTEGTTELLGVNEAKVDKSPNHSFNPTPR